MAENSEDRKMSADGYSSVPGPVTPAGGEAEHSPTDADLEKEVNPEAETVTDGVTKKTKKPEVAVEAYKKKMKEEDEEDDEDEMDDDDDDDEEMEESVGINGLFEGLDLSEEFKEKASLVFEAAVNEAAAEKAAALVEATEADLTEQFETTLSESLEEIVENLDSYLDYVVQEWMAENELAVESGVKVQMAESLMTGLKELFYDHNVAIDEDTIDIVASLEEELDEVKALANKAINERIELEEKTAVLYADGVFNTITEGLSAAQIERFRVLSEKLDHSDLDSYAEDLKTIKESFFTKKSEVIVEDLSQEGDEILTEETNPSTVSAHESVNAYTNFLNNLK